MGKGSLLDKQNRHDRLIGLLRSDEFWTTSKMCDALDISHRTLMRDLAELKQAGYPIQADKGRGGGVRLNGRWGIERLRLSDREFVTLLTSLAITEVLSPSFITAESKSLRQKIASLFPETQRKTITKFRERILVGQPASQNVLATFSSPSEAVMGTIATAFFNYRQLEIHYVSEYKQRTQRMVEAHYIMLNWPVWYLLCWDLLRNEIRIFRTDRITKATLGLETIKPRKKSEFIVAYENYFTSI